VIDGLRYASIADPDRATRLLVMYPAPLPGEPWGVLTPLRGTSWGDQIPEVTGEVWSHALHGHPKPLRLQLGNPPFARARRIPLGETMCLERQKRMCAAAKPTCHPGSGEMPECYVAPARRDALRVAANAVAHAWAEGRYVFVVVGDEFVVT
jgi:hypothetical protein